MARGRSRLGRQAAAVPGPAAGAASPGKAKGPGRIRGPSGFAGKKNPAGRRHLLGSSIGTFSVCDAGGRHHRRALRPAGTEPEYRGDVILRTGWPVPAAPGTTRLHFGGPGSSSQLFQTHSVPALRAGPPRPEGRGAETHSVPALRAGPPRPEGRGAETHSVPALRAGPPRPEGEEQNPPRPGAHAKGPGRSRGPSTSLESEKPGVGGAASGFLRRTPPYAGGPQGRTHRGNIRLRRAGAVYQGGGSRDTRWQVLARNASGPAAFWVHRRFQKGGSLVGVGAAAGDRPDMGRQHGSRCREEPAALPAEAPAPQPCRSRRPISTNWRRSCNPAFLRMLRT